MGHLSHLSMSRPYLISLKMSEVLSPVTGSRNVKKIRIIGKDEIILGYKKAFGVDVRRFFTNASVELYRCLDSDIEFYEPRDSAGDGLFYKALSEHPWYYEDTKWEFDKAMEFVKHDSRLLEIGSGGGAFLERASKIAGEAIGLEYSEVAFELSRRKGLNVKLCEVQDYVEEDCDFDVVCSFQVMEHVDDIKGIIDASLKLLKPNGTLIISVPNNSGYLKNLDRSWLNMPPHHLNLWNVESIKKLSTIFPMELQEIAFDSLRSEHVLGFASSISQNVVKRGLLSKILYKIFIKRLLVQGIDSVKDSINGITLFAVYKKNNLG